MAENKYESSSAFRCPALQGQIPVAHKISLDHMFDHLRILHRFFMVKIAGFFVENKKFLFFAYCISFFEGLGEAKTVSIFQPTA